MRAALWGMLGAAALQVLTMTGCQGLTGAVGQVAGVAIPLDPSPREQPGAMTESAAHDLAALQVVIRDLQHLVRDLECPASAAVAEREVELLTTALAGASRDHAAEVEQLHTELDQCRTRADAAEQAVAEIRAALGIGSDDKGSE